MSDRLQLGPRTRRTWVLNDGTICCEVEIPTSSGQWIVCGRGGTLEELTADLVRNAIACAPVIRESDMGGKR